MESDEFSIKSIVIEPETSPLGGPVRIYMEWISPYDLDDAVWKVFYQVDTIRKRKMLEVLSLPSTHFVSGVNNLALDIPSIDVEGSQSITAGVLVLTLSQRTEELLGINMIVQVIQRDGQLFKIIFSPLE